MGEGGNFSDFISCVCISIIAAPNVQFRVCESVNVRVSWGWGGVGGQGDQRSGRGNLGGRTRCGRTCLRVRVAKRGLVQFLKEIGRKGRREEREGERERGKGRGTEGGERDRI